MRARPADAGAQRVAVAEAAAGHHALEVVQPRTAGLQVGHVHVEGLEAGLGEGVGHLHMRVDALLAQDGHLRAGRFRKGAATSLAWVEAQVHMQAGVAGSARRRVFGIGAGGLSRCWQIFQLTLSQTWCRSAAALNTSLGVAPDLQLTTPAVGRLGVGSCRPHGCADRPCSRSTCITGVALARVRTCSTTPSSSLNSALSVSSSRRALTWPAQFLASPYRHAAVADAVAFGDQHVDVQATPTWPAKAISQAAAHRPPSLRSW
jgi:hypothetical protein